MDRSASNLPWMLVIEALASFEHVDASILIDLVKRTPEIYGDWGKNVREIVSLRILESFLARQKGSTNGASSRLGSNIEIDQSESCEDVVRQISTSNLKMDSPEMLKWDIQTFVMRKRACLPKCTLLQLKDAILQGNNPIIASLKDKSRLSISNRSAHVDVNAITRKLEGSCSDDQTVAAGTLLQLKDAILQGKSGLSISNRSVHGDVNAVTWKLQGNCSDDQTVAAGGNLTSPAPDLDGLMQEDSPNRNLLPSKRGDTDLNTEDLTGKCEKNHVSMENGCDPHLHNSKKLKQDTSFTGQDIAQKSVPLIPNELSEDLLRKNGQHTVREWSGLATSTQVEGLDENRHSEDGHDQHIEASRIPGRGNNAGLQHNLPSISCDKNVVTYQDPPVDESQCGSKHCAEMVNLNTISPNGTHRNNCDDEGRNKYRKHQIDAPNGASLDESCRNNSTDQVKDDVEHNPGEEISSDSDGFQDEKMNIATKKHTFLSSHCTFSQDSLTPAYCSELNICMKCNSTGQLLVCSASACPIVLHQSCLGTEPIFDENGNFYCPFCAYSRAISEYLEAKKEALQTRKDLSVFITSDNQHQENKLPNKFTRPEQSQLRRDDNADREHEANYKKTCANKVSKCKHLEDIKQKQKMKASVSCVIGDVHSGEGSVPVNTAFPVFLEGNTGEENVALNSQSATAFEGQQIVAETTCELDGDKSSCRDIGIVEVTETPAKYGSDSDGDTPQATSQPNIGMEESSEEEDDQHPSRYCIRFRKREMQYTYPSIPMLRRKKLTWTAEEVEILQEGVRRFAGANDRSFPWKMILEFGSNVFQKGRTPVDLKDKWRNMCKGASPKSK